MSGLREALEAAASEMMTLAADAVRGTGSVDPEERLRQVGLRAKAICDRMRDVLDAHPAPDAATLAEAEVAALNDAVAADEQCGGCPECHGTINAPHHMVLAVERILAARQAPTVAALAPEASRPNGWGGSCCFHVGKPGHSCPTTRAQAPDAPTVALDRETVGKAVANQCGHKGDPLRDREWWDCCKDCRKITDAILAVDTRRTEATVKAEALREFADTLGVDVGDDDDEWWRGYRQAQRETIRKVTDRADRIEAGQ